MGVPRGGPTQNAWRGLTATCAPWAPHSVPGQVCRTRPLAGPACSSRGPSRGAPVCRVPAHLAALPPPSPTVPREKTKSTKNSSYRRETAPKSPTPQRATRDTGKAGRPARRGSGTWAWGLAHRVDTWLSFLTWRAGGQHVHRGHVGPAGAGLSWGGSAVHEGGGALTSACQVTVAPAFCRAPAESCQCRGPSLVTK